ncbi:hypothetical protein BJ741DRAFT_538973 [Chytriomyces cf. hyalinus JEL632]|nr:hypothetical protein BJ741DRAFT_538973 [Chytriomyces cf. hyalinus JEL632]
MQSLKQAREELRANGQEEKVEVNQRHLIDKILARYSAENTIFRELLQNSNDAGATAVEIHFKTSPELAPATPPPPPPSSFFGSLVSSFVGAVTAKKQPLANIAQVIYKNNGRPFQGEDWGRLRKIAEGNPDETKIGFFGVGFYSLFSICEEPFVTSDKECMAFFWKGDQLFTKKGAVKEEDVSPWTAFFLDLREPIEAPNASDFGRFLANSLAFTKNLKRVEVFVDDHRILLFDKKAAEPRPLTFPKGVYTLTSPNGIFDLKSISVSKVQLDLTAHLDFENETGKLGEASVFTIYMRIATASVGVKLNAHLSKEMERTTKKKAPPVTDFHVQFSNYDEYDSSTVARSGKGGIFNELIPGPKDQGKIFIGFPTHQTTGCSIHIAAHLIPTVERESIDFVDRSLNIWNQDLITVGGLLSRILFEDEMQSIAELFSGASLDEAAQRWLFNRASHALSAFTFKPSTPSSIVGRLNQMFFYKSSNRPMSMISTQGVLPLPQVRLPDTSMLGFIKQIPIVPAETLATCADLITELKSNNMIQTMGLQDAFVELNKRTLTIDEVVELLKWWRGYKKVRAVSPADSSQLFQLLVVVDPLGAPEKLPVRMFDLKHHVNLKVIPAGMPLPDTVLSTEISKHFSKQDLEETTGFLTELSIPQWLSFIILQSDFKTNSEFVERVMVVVSRQFSNLNKDSQAFIVSLLAQQPCIVTKQGLKLPKDSYFKSVTLFDDLPVVAFESRNLSEVFLKTLGVREHVDLGMVFSRLQDLKWDSDHVQLVKYLTSVQDKLTSAEIARLKLTSVFTKESPITASASEDSSVANAEAKKQRYKASDLFAPNDAIRSLNLPIIDWPGKVKWRSTSDEAKFMMRLGLKVTIPWEELIERAAKSETAELRFKFLDYFIENWKTSYATSYDPMAVRFAFLPSENAPEQLFRPRELYAHPGVAVIGFSFLHKTLQSHAEKFGVREHPNSPTLINVLKTQPPNLENAVAVFSYLAGRQQEFSAQDWNIVRSLKFIPITMPKDSPSNPGGLTWIEPTKVYFGSKNSSGYQDQFIHIDFGETSNAFLRACGVKDEPTPQELAEQLVRNPQSFMNQLGFAKYLQVLRTIAANYYQLRHNRTLVADMRKSAFLVGVRSEPSEATEVTADSLEKAEDEEEEKLHYQLARADEIYVMDDTVLGQIFTPLGCPIETLLEDMYTDLGSQWLTSQVTEVTTPRGNTAPSERAKRLQALINERALLLLYDGQQVRATKDIVSGAEETLKRMEVLEVPEIVIERTFKGVVKTQKTTCCLMMDKWTRKYFLLIKGNEFEVDYFDVAQALGKVIFKKGRLNDSLLLSSLLSTSLVNLKRKGFPVDRILNLQEGKLKAAMAKKQQQEATERREAEVLKKNQEAELKAQPLPPVVNSNAAVPPSAEMAALSSMFPNADKTFLAAQIEAEKGNARAVETISNRLLDTNYPKAKAPQPPASPAPTPPTNNTPPAQMSKNNSASDELIKSASKIADSVKGGFLGNLWNSAKGQLPKTDDERKSLMKPDASSSSNSLNSSSSSTPHKQQTQQTPQMGPRDGAPGGGPPIEEITPNYTENLKKQLSSSINTVKPSTDASFRATIPNESDLKPEVPTRHSNAVCTPLLDSDLTLLAKLPNEIPLYVDKKVFAEAQAVVVASQEALLRFVDLLRLLSRVFGLETKTLNIYWDKSGGTVAFNRGRTLFFNFRFYLGLHFRSGMRPGIVGEDIDSVYYWFMTACHELAHNFVAEHNSQHEFYFSSYAETYLAKLHRALKAEGAEP